MEEKEKMEKKVSTPALSDAIDVGYFDLQKTAFYQTSGGFLGLTYQGKEYKRVSLRRALPIGQPEQYISVADAENKEIGVIRSIRELSTDQMSIVVDELDKRYYSPTVLEVKSVKDKLGYVYMELSVKGVDKAHDRNCAVKDVNKNIRMLSGDKLIIFDVDGNRYIVESLAKLDKKSQKRLEPYLF